MLLFPEELPLQLHWHIEKNYKQSFKNKIATLSLSPQQTTNTQV